MADPGERNAFVRHSPQQVPRRVTLEDAPENQGTHETPVAAGAQHMPGAPMAAAAHLVPNGESPVSARGQRTPSGSSYENEGPPPVQFPREPHGGDNRLPGDAAFIQLNTSAPEPQFSPHQQLPGNRVPRESQPFPPPSPFTQSQQPIGAPWSPGMNPMQIVPPIQIGGDGLPGLANGTGPRQGPIHHHQPYSEFHLQSPAPAPAAPAPAPASELMSPAYTYAAPAPSPRNPTFNGGPSPISPHMQMNMPPLPPSGYDRLAQQLSGIGDAPPITPLYRRFEVLRHRLLLSFQDRLCQLEEQLQLLDDSDTQSRTHSAGITPASCRSQSDNDLSYQRDDILGKIGFALASYNKILAECKEVQSWRCPHHAEVAQYREYLYQGHFIVGDEIKFLDVDKDLFALSPTDLMYELDSPTMKPIMPNSPQLLSPRSRSAVPPRRRPPQRHPPSPPARPETGTHIIYAALATIFLPILAFPFVHSFVQRMVVVLTVVLGAGAVLGQTGLLRIVPGEAMPEYLVCVGVYGAVMAVLAATFDVGGGHRV